MNFPPSQQIFKNLTKLDGKETKSPDAVRKADNLIQKSARKVADQSRKSSEIREEISELINELVDLEYSEEDKHPTTKFATLPCEDDFLSFSKFSSPTFLLPNKRTETQRYIETVDEEIMQKYFKSDDYLSVKAWNYQELNPKVDKTTSCKCLSEFYNQHSSCS